MNKIVYLDVDGTLLDKNGKLSDFNKKVIIEIQKKGIYVALATGRNYSEIKEITKELEIDQNLNYSICQNGAYVTKTSSFEPTHTNLIDMNEAKKLYDFLNKKEIFTYVSNFKNQDIYFTNLDLKSKNFNQKLLPKISLTKIDKTFNWDLVSMMGFECEKDEAEFLENYLKDNFEHLEYICSRSAHRIKPLFMINARATSKATSILKLNQQLNISEANTYFFGDGINDVDAIKRFDNSYVPKSAPEYVKEVAKNIIGEAHADGVGIKLQELFL